MTIGADFCVKVLEIDGKKVKLQILDFGGEERIRFLLPTYVRGADGALFIYDIANYASINNIDDWLSIIRRESSAEVPILLVGLKPNEKNKRQVSVEEGKKIAKSKNLNGFMECNIKTGEYVEKAFEALTRLMLTYPKMSSSLSLSPPPPSKSPRVPTMTPQGKESFPYPISSSRFLNWFRGARWIYCPKCRRKFTEDKYFTHSCKKKLSGPRIRRQRKLASPVGDKIDPRLKSDVQSFLEWIKDREGLSGYINYYLQQDNPSIISELSKIYFELRKIFGV